MSYWYIATATPLILCSVIALALILERTATLGLLRGASRRTKQMVLDRLAQEGPDATGAEIRQLRPFYLEALDILIANADQERALRDESASTVMVEVSSRLRRNLTALTTIAVLAPMFGLLGTVAGLMRAFRDIGLTTGPVNPAVVADGLWQALATTAAGLVIAAFCIVFNALFESRVKRALTNAGIILNRLSLAYDGAAFREKAK